MTIRAGHLRSPAARDVVTTLEIHRDVLLPERA